MEKEKLIEAARNYIEAGKKLRNIMPGFCWWHETMPLQVNIAELTNIAASCGVKLECKEDSLHENYDEYYVTLEGITFLALAKREVPRCLEND